MLEELERAIHALVGNPGQTRRGPLSTMHGISSSAGQRRAMEQQYFTLNDRIRKLKGGAKLRAKYRP